MFQVRTRTRGVLEAKYRLTVDELQLFANQMMTDLPVKLSGQEAVLELVEQVESFQKDAEKLLELSKPDAKDIEKCIEVGSELDVELPQLSQLKAKQKQTEWLEEVAELLEEPQQQGGGSLSRGWEGVAAASRGGEGAIGDLRAIDTGKTEVNFLCLCYRVTEDRIPSSG